jgi:pyrimidine operon attenuation protein/uracil phosphoribosyltransferase
MTIPRSAREGAGGAGRAGEPAGGRVVLDAAAIERATRRMAHEILERERQPERMALVAIAEGGLPVADLLAAHLRELTGAEIARGALDVTLYRDDVIARGERPLPRRTRLDFSVSGRRVILVEDVVFTGRTVRAAMDAVIDFGRPEAIEVATLVDRGHREFPIRVDYVGKNIPTSRAERVVLRRTPGGELEVVVV